MDDRTAILLVSFVILATTLIVFVAQWVRSRRDRDDDRPTDD